MISINNEKSSSYHLLFLLLLLLSFSTPSSYFFSLLNYLRICWLESKVPYHPTDTSPKLVTMLHHLRTTLFSPFVKQSVAPATPTEYFNAALSLWNCRSCDVLPLHMRAHHATRKPQASNAKYYLSPKTWRPNIFRSNNKAWVLEGKLNQAALNTFFCFWTIHCVWLYKWKEYNNNEINDGSLIFPDA